MKRHIQFTTNKGEAVPLWQYRKVWQIFIYFAKSLKTTIIKPQKITKNHFHARRCSSTLCYEGETISLQNVFCKPCNFTRMWDWMATTFTWPESFGLLGMRYIKSKSVSHKSSKTINDLKMRLYDECNRLTLGEI